MSIYDLLSLSCHKFLNFKIENDEKFPSIHMEKWQNARILICFNKDFSFGLFSHIIKCFKFRSNIPHLMIITYL